MFLSFSIDQLLAFEWSQAQLHVFQLVLKSHMVLKLSIDLCISLQMVLSSLSLENKF